MRFYVKLYAVCFLIGVGLGAILLPFLPIVVVQVISFIAGSSYGFMKIRQRRNDAIAVNRCLRTLGYIP